MKLVSLRIKASGAVIVGAVIGETFLDLQAASGGELPATMIEFFGTGQGRHGACPGAVCRRRVWK